MPGVIRLAKELGVARDSMEAALKELERTGELQGSGAGRGRTIRLEKNAGGRRGLRIQLLLGEPFDRKVGHMAELVHALQDAGHVAGIAAKTQLEMGDKVERIARLVDHTDADAWVVFCGSRQVLEWFEKESRPVFAFAGRANQVPIASIAPDKVTPLRQCLRRLVGMGHRRIVMMARPIRTTPSPGLFERAFLEELEALGIATGPYNLPVWNETVDGFHESLHSLFRFTPPTALIIDEEPFITAAFQFCIAKRLHVPRDLSMICTDPGPTFEWCKPSVAHIRWDSGLIVRRIVRWANNLSQGLEDRRKGYTKAEFVDGGTIGVAKRV
jgi:DNA-binding LacI/PurR family transcriptional regulator